MRSIIGHVESILRSFHISCNRSPHISFIRWGYPCHPCHCIDYKFVVELRIHSCRMNIHTIQKDLKCVIYSTYIEFPRAILRTSQVKCKNTKYEFPSRSPHPRPSSIVHCPSSIVCHPSSIVHCPSSVVRCPSSVVHRPSSILHHPSSIVHRPSSIVRRPSSVVRRPSFVVRSN